jgi:superfamily I DNA and/or RNA helicase
VRTIDGWQGREKEIIVFSCVRNNSATIGFLENFNRINVALTRAKHGMIMVGNEKTLRMDDKWNSLMDKLEGDNLIVRGIDGFKAKVSYLANQEL